MEHNHGGLEDHFPSKWLISRFHVNLPGVVFFFVATIWLRFVNIVGKA